MRKWKLGHSACLTVCAALVFSSAMAADGGQKQLQKHKTQTTSDSVDFHGVQVAIDPVTGHLREPTEADRKALSRVIKQDRALRAQRGNVDRPQTEAQAKATLKTSAHGRVGAMMQVPESQMNYLMVERTADGSLSVHHQGDKSAEKVEEVLK